MQLVIIFVLFLLASSAWADEKPKGPTCQEQLSDATMQAYNLDLTRDQLERVVAHKQVEIFTLQNQIGQLQKTIEELKKPVEKPKE